jgi:hypothetical protein
VRRKETVRYQYRHKEEFLEGALELALLCNSQQALGSGVGGRNQHFALYATTRLRLLLAE